MVGLATLCFVAAPVRVVNSEICAPFPHSVTLAADGFESDPRETSRCFNVGIGVKVVQFSTYFRAKNLSTESGSMLKIESH